MNVIKLLNYCILWFAMRKLYYLCDSHLFSSWSFDRWRCQIWYSSSRPAKATDRQMGVKCRNILSFRPMAMCSSATCWITTFCKKSKTHWQNWLADSYLVWPRRLWLIYSHPVFRCGSHLTLLARIEVYCYECCYSGHHFLRRSLVWC